MTELDPEAEKVVICSTGHRSSMGCSILKQHGLSRVNNAAGGMTGYNAAGFGPECPICALSWAGKVGRGEKTLVLWKSSGKMKFAGSEFLFKGWTRTLSRTLSFSGKI